MKVTVITTCRNSQATIEDTLNSVFSQNYPNIEYIVIDGKSTDHTLEIINKYRSRISLIISEEDAGVYYAINKGISLATGDIIANLNSDDFYSGPDILTQIVSTFRDKGVEAVYGDLHYVDRNNPDKTIRNWISGEYREGLFLKGWMPPHPAFFVKKQVYSELGIYNTDLKSAADYELMLRFIHKHKISIAYLPQVIVKMRMGGKSNASVYNRIKANLEDRKAWEINNLQPDLLTLFLKPLLKIRQYW